MTEPVRDRWAEWLLERRFGGDAGQRKAFLEGLLPWRERILKNAAVREGETLLDVGAGDGLIAFGALDLVGEGGRVIFSDISQDLLDHARNLAEEMGVVDRCEFLLAAADDLSALGDASVDIATTRSVLIYVEDKRRAFEEFHRVLKPGGRLSIFEPINRFCWPEPEGRFLGFDVEPVSALARKVRAVFERASGDETLIDFDERDLLAFAERAGFGDVELDLHAEIHQAGSLPWGTRSSWDVFVQSSGNPCAPTLAEAMDEALTPEERARFEGHLRSLFDARAGTSRSAVAYLRALKS